MSEDDRPVVPTYKREVFSPPPAHLLAGHPSPASNGAAANPPVKSPPLIHGIEESRPMDVNALVGAATVLHKALLDRIAFHQGELRKLQAVLAKFAGASTGAQDVPQSGGDLDELLRIARKLEEPK